MEQYLPSVSNGALQLTLQTYNPTGAGNSFLGSEIISDQTFNDTAGGIAFTAVAKLDTTMPGMVGGIFAYNYNDSTGLDNESDFESLTNDTTGQNNQEQTNVYSNQPLGAGNPEFVSIPGLNLTDYNTYTVEWFPTELLWFIDGQRLPQMAPVLPHVVRRSVA
jgi:beta-glucanase (GH16 family)